MRRTILAPPLLMIVVLEACASSHGLKDGSVDASPRADGGAADSRVLDDGALPDGALADGASPDSARPPDCRMRCTVEPVAAAELLAPVGGDDGVTVAAAANAPGGEVHVLPARTATAPASWAIATLDTSRSTMEAWTGQEWPRFGEPLWTEIGAGVDAVVRPFDATVESIVLAARGAGRSSPPWNVFLWHVRWAADRTTVESTELGEVAPVPALAWPHGTLFELPSGDVMALVPEGESVRAARIEWAAGSAPSIAERFDVALPVSSESGVPAIDGVGLADDRWAIVGGGRTDTDAWPAFVVVGRGSATLFSGPLGGDRDDPAPLVTVDGRGAVVFRWEENPRDIDDASLVATRLSEAGLGQRTRLPAPRLPFPLDAHVGATERGAFAIWSVHAPDEAADTLVYLALLDPVDGCGAAEVIRLARFRGAIGSPSVYALPEGPDLLVLGLPLGPDGTPELVALRAHCAVDRP